MLKSEAGKKAPSTNKAADPTATQRVQRGTKRPVGKRKKKTMRDGKPSTSSPNRVTGNHQPGWTAASTAGMLGKEAPKATREKEASQAIQSSDLRQKMSTATAKYTSANKRLITTQ
jgi:hypothetical protein